MAFKSVEISSTDLCDKIIDRLSPEQSYSILLGIMKGGVQDGNESEESNE